MRTLAAGILIAVLSLSPGALAQTPELLSGLEFRNIGPAIMSGRISDIVIHPTRRATWYVAVGSGGVWKTENAGTTWTPVFDAQGAYSIGCITLDPANPETVWVGTGENVSGRHVGYGDGVYRSLNGGKTWTNMGLKASEHVARILVDPRDSRVVYVAAEGPLWSAGGERGLYKSVDGGKTWAISLEISKDTGVTSAEMDPSNPDILYAAAYQRRRTVAAFMGGGPESAIYKSEDAGKTWRKLDVGLPKGDIGKIGLAVSPIDPRVVYATVEASPDERGFYRSSNKGESFEKRSSFISGGTGPHYYQEIFADPNTFDRVYQMNPGLMVTHDGGKTFVRVPEKNKHGDNHAMAFVPGDADYILNGSDGGVYETHDRGETWRFFENLPVTQFYKLALDNALPFYNVHGGAQDNGSQMGPSRTLNWHGISNFDWTITYGADGYAIAVDPTDPDTVYLEWQEGNLLRYDRKSHETIYISPKPGPGDPPLRFNWDSPVIVSPHAHTRIYYASQYVWRSDDRGDSWKQISPDLTRNVFRLTQPIMGRTWSADALWDHGAMSMFSTISTHQRVAAGRRPHLRGDRRWGDPGDGGRGRDVAEDRETAGRARQLLRQQDPGLANRQGRRVRGGRLPQDGGLRALPAAQRRPRAHVDVDRRRPAGAHDRVGRGAGPREARPAVCRDGVRHLRDAQRREELAQARRRRAGHLVPRHRDPGARERPGGRVLRAQLLRARRLLAAAPHRRGGPGRAGDPVSREEGPVLHPAPADRLARQELAGRDVLSRAEPAVRRRVHATT